MGLERLTEEHALEILEKLMEAIINPIKTPEFLEKYVAMVCCRILVVNLEVYSHLNYI